MKSVEDTLKKNLVARDTVEPELASERLFVIFSLMILAGTIRIQLSLQGQNSERTRSRLERNLESRKGNLVTKNARSGMKEFVSGI